MPQQNELNVESKKKRRRQRRKKSNNQNDLMKNIESIEPKKENNTEVNIIPSLEIKEDIKKQKNKKYVSFTQKLISNSILVILFITLTLILTATSFSVKNNQKIKYDEKGTVDYKVFLKENTFYENNYLEKDMLYISNLIDNIHIDFDYDFKLEEASDVLFTYKIIGELSIMDNTAKNVFYQQEFVLLDTKIIQMTNGTNQKIKEKLDVDYSYYNNIANEFKNKFGVNITSNFIIKLIINEQNGNKYLDLNKNAELSTTIPLAQREIRITTSNLHNSNSISKNTQIKMNNHLNLSLAIIFAIITIILIIKLIKKIILIIPKKSIYDKYVTNILKEYDRYIINTKSKPILKEDSNIIKLDDFQELLDVRDTIKKPIKYYSIVEHQKCMFYIATENDIYQYIVKEVDLENIQ